MKQNGWGRIINISGLAGRRPGTAMSGAARNASTVACPTMDCPTISVPSGYAEFPREIVRPPRTAAARVFTDIRRWSIMPRGGHFAALEQPELLADEVRAFFRELR